MSGEEKITCYTPTQGRDGATRIPKWKYDCIRRAILIELEEADDGQVLFKDLATKVSARLTSNQLAKLGSVTWHVTSVKLNMEVEEELERVPRQKPQALRRPV